MSRHSIVGLGQDALLKGKVVHTRHGHKPVHAFLGIPYAKPPVGELRFKRPQPVPLWQGTRDAFEYGPVCPQPFGEAQIKMYGGSVEAPKMSEDCLYLNVWTPNPSKDAKLPVMVWIYGGGFVYGFSNMFDGTAYADKQDVVFVSLNYRVGICGFMCLEDEKAPGNMGLLDQVMALKWIQENIGAFGGDPDNVTLFGESAGGISTSYHTISKLSRGLFHKIICQSGVCLSDFFFWPTKNAKKYITKRVQSLGCPARSSEEIMEWLKDKDVLSLVDELGEGFFPVFDKHFIEEHPIAMYSRGDFQQVPAIIGCTSHEGTMFVFGQDTTRVQLSSYEEAQFTAKTMILGSVFRGRKNADKVYEAAWDLYIGQETDLIKISELVVDMFGDIIFVIPSITAADLHSSKCPTYMYKYTHRSFRSQWPEWVDADHGEEVELVLGFPFLEAYPDVWPEEEKWFSEQLMSYWANFARTGNPNGAGLDPWSKYDSHSRKVISLNGRHGSRKSSKIDVERLQFWTVKVPKIIEGSETSKL